MNLQNISQNIIQLLPNPPTHKNQRNSLTEFPIVRKQFLSEQKTGRLILFIKLGFSSFLITNNNQREIN